MIRKMSDGRENIKEELFEVISKTLHDIDLNPCDNTPEGLIRNIIVPDILRVVSEEIENLTRGTPDERVGMRITRDDGFVHIKDVRRVLGKKKKNE